MVDENVINIRDRSETIENLRTDVAVQQKTIDKQKEDASKLTDRIGNLESLTNH